jgi:ABC-type dipeptide/oligopeptide/nickel transport system permease subunit
MNNVMTKKVFHNASLLCGGGILLVLVLWAILTPLITGGAYNSIVGQPFEPLGAPHHLFGTDQIGRDLFERLAVAARYGLMVSAFSTMLAAVCGTLIGLLAGYMGGLVDAIVMRIVDVMLAIPAILTALLVSVIAGKGIIPLTLTLGVVNVPTFIRILRAPAMTLRERDFIKAAEIAGQNKFAIAVRHLLPNTWTPVLVQFAGTASEMVLLEAVLSYLGQGIQPPEPSAGRMISDSLKFMGTYPMQVALPALLIITLTLAWNLLSDGLQMVFSTKAIDDLPAISHKEFTPIHKKAIAENRR